MAERYLGGSEGLQPLSLPWCAPPGCSQTKPGTLLQRRAAAHLGAWGLALAAEEHMYIYMYEPPCLLHPLRLKRITVAVTSQQKWQPGWCRSTALVRPLLFYPAKLEVSPQPGVTGWYSTSTCSSLCCVISCLAGLRTGPTNCQTNYIKPLTIMPAGERFSLRRLVRGCVDSWA